MIHNTRKAFTLLLALAFSFILFAQTSQPSNLIFRESYRLADVQNLIMALNSENVEIRNFRGYKVTIEAYSNNSSKCPVIKRSNKSIFIEHSNEHLYKTDYCDLVIYIPYDFQMNSFEFISDSGCLAAQEIWANKVTARSNSGSVSFESITTGDTFSASSSKGILKVDRFSGEYFEITNENGSVEMNNVRAEYFNASSGSAEIFIQLSETPIAASQLKSNRGNIILEIPQTESFNLMVLSNSGTFRDNIRNQRSSGRGEHEYKYGRGGALITMQTTSGDITLE
ncbi:MAG: DUF4097 domain-containing protein [Treponema sp.]|nr:DUF4097 domain-containing protein [Treponema sp.]